MNYILMQPDNSQESLKVLGHLTATGKCIFELSLASPRLCPIAFSSRSNLPYEVHYHFFVGDIACGHWGIARNCRYLWRKIFYRICDCNTIKEILEYTGSIYQLCRWSQELFAYDFSIIRRPAKMMKDIDTCSRHINTLIHQYLVSAYSICYSDILFRCYAYSYDVFHHCSNPHHVTASSTSLIATSSSVTFPSILHYCSLQFLQSPSLVNLSTQPLTTSPIFITPKAITWFSFDSIIPSFGSLLHPFYF